MFSLRENDLVQLSLGSGDTVFMENFFMVGEVKNIYDDCIELLYPLVYVFEVQQPDANDTIAEGKTKGVGMFRLPFSIAVNSDEMKPYEKSMIIPKEKINTLIKITNKNSNWVTSYLTLRSRIYTGIELAADRIKVSDIIQK